MNLSKISAGKDLPNQCNVIIEISMNAGPIKYEFDKESGAIVVDRFMPTSMSYPCNYGFIPHTLSGDGDPVDVLVYSNHPIIPGAVIAVKPIGVLITEDEKGADEKVLAVPADKVDPFFANVHSYHDLPEIVISKIKHFFENYKALEPGKWVKVTDWKDAEAAKAIITEGAERDAVEVAIKNEKIKAARMAERAERSSDRGSRAPRSSGGGDWKKSPRSSFGGRSGGGSSDFKPRYPRKDGDDFKPRFKRDGDDSKPRFKRDGDDSYASKPRYPRKDGDDFKPRFKRDGDDSYASKPRYPRKEGEESKSRFGGKESGGKRFGGGSSAGRKDDKYGGSSSRSSTPSRGGRSGGRASLGIKKKESY